MKFIQISTCIDPKCVDAIVHALDDEGRVWFFDINEGVWHRYSDGRGNCEYQGDQTK